jgi:hypothetical protein
MRGFRGRAVMRPFTIGKQILGSDFLREQDKTRQNNEPL